MRLVRSRQGITEKSVGSLWFNADPIPSTLLFHGCRKLGLKTLPLPEAWRCSVEDVAGGTVGCASGCSSLIRLCINTSSSILGRLMVASVGGNLEFSHQNNTMQTDPLFSPTKMRTFHHANG